MLDDGEAPAPAQDPEPASPPDSRDVCALLQPIDVVEYRFAFRNLLPLMDVVAEVVIDAALRRRELVLGSTRVAELAFTYVADLRFEQVWRLIETQLGDLSSVVALAPGEQTTLTIKKTQRTTMTRNVVDSSESMTGRESTQIDKDVLNVARSTTKSNQWRVDSSATINIGPVGNLGVSAGYSESTSSTVSSSLQRIAEATEKSSSQLKALQKTEVNQSQEVTDETSERRRIANPYRDRSLMLHVFDLYKRFQVTVGLTELRPALAMELPALVLDRDFVLGNADFLEAKLLDSGLLEELRASLQTVQRPVDVIDDAEARWIAQRALHLLFVEPVVVGDPALGDVWDIARSLRANGGGLRDACHNKFGLEYTTLLYYNSFYRGLTEDERGRWAVRIAVTLAETLATNWAAADKLEQGSVLDGNEATELIRRLSGFLSLVEKLLKPLLVPADDARLAHDARERAEFVLSRVVAHLDCYRDFYVQHYLEHVYRRTEGLTVIRLFHDLLREAGREDLLEHFDPASGFVEGNRFVVPARDPVSPSAALKWVEALGGQASELDAPPRVTVTTIPTDGVHVEPSPGRCLLADVPEERVDVHTELKVSAGERPVGGES